MIYDLIIIGGGAGGFAGAIKAKELGLKALMVNSGLPLGGTCVNVGCVPSKFLIHTAEILNQAKNHKLNGLEIEIKKLDFAKVIEEELNLVANLRKEKYEKVLEGLKIDFIEGKAKFVSNNEILVNGQKYSAQKFLIAVGLKTLIPPIEGIEKINYLTHETILQIKELPKTLLILGAGPIGLEFGQAFSRFGSKVIILEALDRFLPQTEKEIADRLKEILEKEGIEIYLKAKVVRFLENLAEVEIDGKLEKFSFDQVLIATGKRANTKDLGLENAGVEIDERGSIKVNQFLETSNPNIFAVGDCVNLPLRLETTSAHEGTIAVENAFSQNQKSIDYSSVPYTIFTDPQVAGIGYTEAKQIQELKVCACRVLDFKDVPKALIIKKEGLIKMLINSQTKEITGVHLLSPIAGDLISQAIWLIKNKITIDELIDSLPVFPTLSESIKLVALSFVKNINQLSCCI
jgi:mercuric reductase